MLLPWLCSATIDGRGYAGTSLHPFFDVAAHCVATEGGDPRPYQTKTGGSWRTKALAHYLRSIDVVDDPVSDVEKLQLMICKLLLWPATNAPRKETKDVLATHPNVERLPPLDDGQVEELARWLEVDVAAGWKRGAIRGSMEAPMLRQFFELHTKDQLADLCKELGHVQYNKKADTIARVLETHTPKKPLKLPKAIKPLGKAKARRK